MTVRNVMKRFPTHMQLAACLLASGLLAGCTADQVAMEQKYQPYAGSEEYPIHLHGGKASVKPCGNWLKDTTSDATNDLASNHGCAVQSNIAAMISDPSDLKHSGKMGPVNSALRTPIFIEEGTEGTKTASEKAGGEADAKSGSGDGASGAGGGG
jgi:type IV pilus biogenesis protein CpaD/CtpE